MSNGGKRRILRHGTTRMRAENILRDGPKANFIEPGSQEPAGGFSAAPAEGPFPVGTPEFYATRKASLYPDEGGPAVVEFEVPEEILDLLDNTGGEFRFLPGFGLRELLDAWPSLPKRIH